MTTGFATSYRRSAYVTPKSQRVAQKAIFSLFWNKSQFNRIKSATKFLALALRTERQSARMWNIKNSGLDQHGAGPYKQQQFGIAGLTGLRARKQLQMTTTSTYHWRSCCLEHRVVCLVWTFRHIRRLFSQLCQVHVTQWNNVECIQILIEHRHTITYDGWYCTLIT